MIMLGKKSSIALSTFGLALISANAFAITTTSRSSIVNTERVASVTNLTQEMLVTIPNQTHRFEAHLAALWLKPGASNLNYVIYNNELPTQSPTWIEHELRPSYDLGFDLGGRVLFPEGKDINLAWQHLNSTTSSSTTAPDASFFLGPDYQIGPNSIPVRNATGEVEFKYDVVNLDAGQTAQFGPRLGLRFFGGLSTTFLREQVTATYTGSTLLPPIGPFSLMQQVYSNFTGIGPRFGIGSEYSFDYGIGVMGEAAASVLVGSSYTKTSFTSSAAELLLTFGQLINDQWIRDQTTVQVVPGFDAKLGLTYSNTFARDFAFKLKAGYQAAVYVNAINQFIPQTLVEPFTDGGIFVATMSHTQSNYSVQGPFFEADLLF